MNPVSGKGVSDQDITAFRFALLECDAVPIPLQISLFARLPLPIAAIITSGGRSIHAWLQVNAPNAAVYRQCVEAVHARLNRLGIDRANWTFRSAIAGRARVHGVDALVFHADSSGIPWNDWWNFLHSTKFPRGRVEWN